MKTSSQNHNGKGSSQPGSFVESSIWSDKEIRNYQVGFEKASSHLDALGIFKSGYIEPVRR